VRIERTGEAQESLERLRGDEAALERDIASARDDAVRIVEGARNEAARIAAAGRADVEAERQRARDAEAASLAAELDRARAAIAVELAALRERAARNREAVVERALAVVTGGGAA
jgi:hypothetical protein